MRQLKGTMLNFSPAQTRHEVICLLSENKMNQEIIISCLMEMQLVQDTRAFKNNLRMHSYQNLEILGMFPRKPSFLSSDWNSQLNFQCKESSYQKP